LYVLPTGSIPTIVADWPDFNMTRWPVAYFAEVGDTRVMSSDSLKLFFLTGRLGCIDSLEN
jgi:hypothetical protein